MKKITLNLKPKYSIHIGRNLLTSNELLRLCQTLASTIVIIIADQNVSELYGKPILKFLRKQRIQAYLLPFVGGEKNKSRKTKELLENKMLELKCGRDTSVIAVGGGITTDIAGFIASTYCRGIPVIYVPTSLLAMVDASIGGKTGVNTSCGKNLIGTFYQPQAVFIDIKTLQTLPHQEFKNGIVELIKHALIKDTKLFNFLLHNVEKIKRFDELTMIKIIADSCKIKKQLVERDEKEQGARQLCNFGHTIGHALESITNYQISHGAAVALGIVAENSMSLKLGFMAQADFDEIKNIFKQFDIATNLSATTSVFAGARIFKTLSGKRSQQIINELKTAMQLDKKSIAQIPQFVLLDAIGKPHLSLTGYSMSLPEKIIDTGIRALLD